MKYLVNRETKEHVVAPPWHCEEDLKPEWAVVEADSEGWIPWSGGECPLPDNCPYQIKTILGKLFDTQFCPQENQYWGGRSILHYRPILTEQSEPNLFEHLVFDKNPETVFDRLQSAVRASSEIPSIIEEINALLPSGYVVVKTESIEAQPVEDMSDWRNWREGDLLQCTRDYLGEPAFKLGGVYTIKFIMQSDPSAESMNRIGIVEDDAGSTNNAWQPRFFRWHSRPTGATK